MAKKPLLKIKLWREEGLDFFLFFFNCYYFYFLMIHFNCFRTAWILWLFPLRHFVSGNFDGSLGYCRGTFNGVLNLLVEFHLYI